jgi:hypothetical protein
MRLKHLFSSTILRAPDDGTGAATTPESILFPKEGTPATPPAPAGAETPAAGDPPADAGTTPPADGSTPPADDKAPEWKEYVNDDTKSAEENATLKAAHDATKPADQSDVANQVPADGKYTLTMPDGVTVDQPLLDALSPDFKEMGLTNAQAQKLADKFIEAKTKEANDRNEGWAKTLTKWKADAAADPEMGGDKWSGTVSKAVKAIDALGTPELKNYLEASGGGNHPELIRLMSKVGDLISEDTPPAGGDGGSGKPADPAHVLFPNDVPKGN